MDQAQQKEAMSRAKKELTPEMKAKIRAMAIRSNAVSGGIDTNMATPGMANAIRQKAVAADERLKSAAANALRFVLKPKSIHEREK